MSTEFVFAIVFAVLFFGLFGGSMIALAMGAVSVVLVTFLVQRPMFELLGQVLWSSSFQFLLVCIPMFILMSGFLSRSGLSTYLFDFFAAWLGRLPGGLTHSILAGAGLFGAATGSAVADAAAMSVIAYPQMTKRGYGRNLVTGALSAGGTIGILMPPSITMVFFAFLTGTPLNRLFIGGIVPAVIMVVLLMITTVVVVRMNPGQAPREPLVPWRERTRRTLLFAPVFLAIASVLTMIYLGVTTPTEAAATGAFTFLVLTILYRKFSLKMLIDSLKESAVVTSSSVFIMVCAYAIVFFTGYYNVPLMLRKFIDGLQVHPLLVIAVIYLILIVLGMVMDAMAIQLIAIPLLTPVLVAMGFDPVWWGVMFVILIQIALVSPPVGLCVYVVSAACPGSTVSGTFRGVLPFFAVMVLTLVLLTIFPEIVLWLPNRMG